MRRRDAALVAALLGFTAGLGEPARAQQPEGLSKAGVTATEVIVRPGDILEIGVWPDERLGGKFVVEESGYVYLPVLGRVRAAGVSLDRLRNELRQAYGSAIKNPVVTITPMFRVGVVGAVMRPGLYLVDPSYSFFDVLTQAGGFQPNADQEKIRVVRGTEVIEINAKEALESGRALDGLALRSGDHIIVPAKTNLNTLRLTLSVLQTALLVAVAIRRLQ
jgi:protein involved in polysaccharide export with SLBB domain